MLILILFCDLSCLKKKTMGCLYRFMDLSSVLEPGRTPKTDKPAIIDDAIRILNQLRDEAHKLEETNQKLLEEIKSLKVGCSLSPKPKILFYGMRTDS